MISIKNLYIDKIKSFSHWILCPEPDYVICEIEHSGLTSALDRHHINQPETTKNNDQNLVQSKVYKCYMVAFAV